jgi:hypothetical protein
MRIPRSVLNPYYNPDLLEYASKDYIPNEKNKPNIDAIINEQKKYLNPNIK